MTSQTLKLEHSRNENESINVYVTPAGYMSNLGKIYSKEEIQSF